MPLTPLPQSNTKRYFLSYLADTQRHHVQIRVADTVSDGAAITELQALVTGILPQAYSGTVFDILEVADSGSDIRNVVAGWTSQTGTLGSGEPDNIRPYTYGFAGRSPSGRKVKLFLFGMSYNQPDTWRFIPGAATDFDSFITQLNATADFYLAIDGTKPVWYDYINIAVNDHWVKVARG
jgi:hypothetical protein